MKATAKDIGQKVGITFLVWVFLLVSLSIRFDPIIGFFGASLLAGAGFLLWLFLVYPKLGKPLAGALLDPNGEWHDPDSETRLSKFMDNKSEQWEQNRESQDYLDRVRRGDPRSGG